MSDVKTKLLSEVVRGKLDEVGPIAPRLVEEIHGEIGRRVMRSMGLRKIFGLRNKKRDPFSIYALFEAKNLSEVKSCVEDAVTFVLKNDA